MAHNELPHHDRNMSQVDIASLIAGYLAAGPGSADRLASLLTSHARATVGAFLKSDGPDTEDLAQESVLAVLDYIRNCGKFEGNLIKFTNTVSRNRCRNFLIWRKRQRQLPLESFEPFLANSGDDPLDEVLGAEVLELLQTALDRLDQKCRSLLRDLFLDGITAEQIRRREGVKTVQTIYYRRARCLKQAGKFLKKRLLTCSSYKGQK